MLPIDAANGGGAHNALARPKLKEAAKRSRGQAARLRGRRKEEQMNCTRRTFVRGAAASGVVAALAGFATACSPAGGAGSNEEGRASAEGMVELPQPDETAEADVVVVGAGISGLAATVSALESGAKVITLEASDVAGGNGQGTEGVFACGSSLQKERGIEFSLKDIVAKELEFFNYRVDALRWKDLVSASAGNIEWLMEQGVEFGDVDNYHGQGQVDGFHWFASGTGSSYIAPMVGRVQSLGGDIRFNTRARQVLTDDDGAVLGVRAEKDDGTVVQIDCRAVVLASGGYADSDEKLAEMGVDVSSITRKGFAHHEGDGIDMAVAAGGVDVRQRHCIMREPGVEGYAFETPLGAMGVRNGGPFVFVNGDGERYTNENCIVANQAYMANTVMSQGRSFAVIGNAGLQWVEENVTPGIVEAAEDALGAGAKAYKADTIEELASLMEVDADALQESIERYNGFCRDGSDEDFNKDPEMLIPFEEGPYWAFKHGLFYFSTIGGIATNRRFEVVDASGSPIPGLYAVGTDGCELYLETYTVMVPASCNANNVNSGRVAGREAAEYCKVS